MSKANLSLRSLESRVGEEVGVSPWVDITQERIDLFAKATEDFQWIHVDPERAKDSPYGGTIAPVLISYPPVRMLFSRRYNVRGLFYWYENENFAPLKPGEVVDLDVEIWRVLQTRFGRVSVERILSGPGLLNLYQALAVIELRFANSIAVSCASGVETQQRSSM